MKLNNKKVNILFATNFGFIFLSLITFVATKFDYTIFGWLSWNIFLAVIPLWFALMAVKFKKTKLLLALFLLLWFLFFPNSLYLVTDFFHMGDFAYFPPTMVSAYPWTRLVYITIAYIIGTMAGLVSLNIIHRELLNKLSKFKQNALLGIYFLLSGFALFIGRFPRINSWDVINPPKLINKVVNSMNPFAVVFIIIMTIYIAFSYVGYLMFCEKNIYEVEK